MNNGVPSSTFKILFGIVALAFLATLIDSSTSLNKTLSPNLRSTVGPLEKIFFSEAGATRSATPDPSQNSARASTAPMTLSEFKELTDKTLTKLPTVAELQDVDAREVHHMPRLLLQAGEDLGVIAESLDNNPALASEAATFYQECFTRESLPIQVRGLCLANHRRLRRTQGDQTPWTPQEIQVPLEVLRLAALVPAQ